MVMVVTDLVMVAVVAVICSSVCVMLITKLKQDIKEKNVNYLA